jgi:hypothetical protein
MDDVAIKGLTLPISLFNFRIYCSWLHDVFLECSESRILILIISCSNDLSSFPYAKQKASPVHGLISIACACILYIVAAYAWGVSHRTSDWRDGNEHIESYEQVFYT